MTKALPSRRLDEAAELISQPGAWHQGSWFDTCSREAVTGNYKCMCAEGALILATGSRYELQETAEHRFLMKAIDQLPGLYTNVPDWNDEEGRTQEEVVAVFKAAAELARSEGQ